MTATRAEAAAADGAQAEEAARRVGASARETAEKVAHDSTKSLVERRAADLEIDQIDSNVLVAKDTASRAVLDAPLAEAKFRQVLLAGDEKHVRLINTTKQLVADHPGNDAVRIAAMKLRGQMLAGRANYLGVTALDLGDKGAKQAADHTPWSWAHSYRDFQERFTLSEGTLEDEPAASK
jgi:hypothetical protein